MRDELNPQKREVTLGQMSKVNGEMQAQQMETFNALRMVFAIESMISFIEISIELLLSASSVESVEDKRRREAMATDITTRSGFQAITKGNKGKNETKGKKYIHKQFTILFLKHEPKVQSNKSTLKALSRFDMARHSTQTNIDCVIAKCMANTI